MGRPRKYFTPEEKRLADCAKSARHHKNNRKKINRKRRKARARANGESKDTKPTPSKTTRHSEAETAQIKAPRLTRLQILMQRVEASQGRLKELMGGKSESEYLTGLCRRFVDIYPQDYARAAAVIEEENDVVEAMHDSLRRVGGEIYEAGGYGDEYKAYKKVEQRFSYIASSVAHLNGDAFVPEQLVEDFLAGRLAFQC